VAERDTVAGEDQQTGNRQDAVLRAAGAVGANVTVLTALLVYFGWQRSEVHNRELGFDQSVLGMTTQDYLLRSVGPLLPPLALAAVAGLAWLRVHAALTAAIARGARLDRLAWVAWGLRLTWLLLPLAGLAAAWWWPGPGFVLYSASFGAGALLTVYGGHLAARIQVRRGEPPDPVPAWQTSTTRLLVAVLALISLFWTASNYAELLGSSLAAETASTLAHSPGVVIYSEQRMSITAPGVDEEALGGPDPAYRYRYTGLRFMEHTGGRYFLLSDGWTPQYGVVVVLADDDPIRLEFVRDLRP
jgi:hypothetical protein